MSQRGVVLIPAFNEAKTLRSICRKLQEAVPEVDIIVIDDGSEDGSLEVLRENVIDYVQHPRNLGYIEALRTGLRLAERSKRPFACFFDADGQHRVEDLKSMLEEFSRRQKQGEGIDLLIGSRFLSPGGEPTSLLRGLGNKFFCFFLWLLSGRRFTDISNGLKLLSSRAIDHALCIPMEDAHAELLLSALQEGLVVAEHPVQVLERSSGTSMISGIKALWYPLRTLLAMLVVYRNRSFGGREKR